jgi:hypothetical protein
MSDGVTFGAQDFGDLLKGEALSAVGVKLPELLAHDVDLGSEGHGIFESLVFQDILDSPRLLGIQTVEIEVEDGRQQRHLTLDRLVPH